MDIEEMKSKWKKVKTEASTDEQLLKLRYARNVPRYRKMMLSVVAECLLLVTAGAVTMIITSEFSGRLWLSIPFVTCIVMFVGVNGIGLSYMLNQAFVANVAESLKQFSVKTKRVRLAFQVLTVILCIITIYTFSLLRYFPAGTAVPSALLVSTLMGVAWRLASLWSGRAKNLDHALGLLTNVASDDTPVN